MHFRHFTFPNHFISGHSRNAPYTKKRLKTTTKQLQNPEHHLSWDIRHQLFSTLPLTGRPAHFHVLSIVHNGKRLQTPVPEKRFIPS